MIQRSDLAVFLCPRGEASTHVITKLTRSSVGTRVSRRDHEGDTASSDGGELGVGDLDEASGVLRVGLARAKLVDLALVGLGPSPRDGEDAWKVSVGGLHERLGPVIHPVRVRPVVLVVSVSSSTHVLLVEGGLQVWVVASARANSLGDVPVRDADGLGHLGKVLLVVARVSLELCRGS